MEDVVRQRRERGLRVTLLLLVVLGSLYGIYILKDIFAPLVAGFLIAYVLDPLADALERMKLSRMASVIIIFSVAAAVAAVIFLTSGYYLTKGAISGFHAVVGEEWLQPDESWTDVPDPEVGVHYHDRNQNGSFDPGYVRLAKERADDLLVTVLGKEWHEDFEEWWKEQTREFETPEGRKRLLAEAQQGIGWIADHRRPSGPEEPPAKGTFDLISWFVFCPLYVFFFLLEIDHIIAAIRKFLPGRYRPRVVKIFKEIDRILSCFFRGRLTICLVKGGITAVGLLVLGVPFAVPLGLAAGFFALIPYIGVWIAIIPALLLSWIDDGSTMRLLGVAGVFGVMEVVEGLVFIPAFLGKDVGLHPLTIIVTLLVFGRLLGVIGLLLSVPLAAISKILGGEFIMPLIRDFAAEPEEKPPPEPPPNTT